MEAMALLTRIGEIVQSKLNLTLAGKIELSAFTVDDIETVFKFFHPKGKGSAYNQFKSQLKAYTTANNIRPNWKQMFQLRDAFGISPEAPKEEPGSLNGTMNDGNAKKEKLPPVVGKEGKLFDATPCTCHNKRFQVHDHGQWFFKDRATVQSWHDQFNALQQAGKIAQDMINPFSVEKMSVDVAYRQNQEKIRQKVHHDEDVTEIQKEIDRAQKAIREGLIPAGHDTNPFAKKLEYLERKNKDSFEPIGTILQRTLSGLHHRARENYLQENESNHVPPSPTQENLSQEQKNKAAYFKALHTTTQSMQETIFESPPVDETPQQKEVAQPPHRRLPF